MFEHEIRLNALMHGLLTKILADVDDSQMDIPPAEGVNPPAFTLAHLVVTNDYALRILGQPRTAPAEWHKRFRPGASPKDDLSPYPSKAALLEAFDASCRKLRECAAAADPQSMNQPHNAELLKGSPVVTTGDALAHLLASHLAFHVGQLSAWRRMQGKLPLV